MARSKYTAEISAMLFTFGEVREPDESTVQYIEDIVRARTAETLIAARDHAFRARGHGSTLVAEDVLFACRHDARLVARLRLVLSWHPLRRKCRDDGVMYATALDAASTGGEDGVLDGLANEEVMFSEERDRVKMPEPWALETVFSLDIPDAVDVEADESLVAAVASTRADLVAADEETASLTRDEYEGWTHARQASFSYRKAKRFREFINTPALLDTQPTDDLIDVLSFIAHDTCRTLCTRTLALRKASDEREAAEDAADSSQGSDRPSKRRRIVASPEPPAPSGPFALVVPESVQAPAISAPGTHADSQPPAPVAPPRQPLTVREVDEALMTEYTERARHRSSGLRLFRSGWRPLRTAWV